MRQARIDLARASARGRGGKALLGMAPTEIMEA